MSKERKAILKMLEEKTITGEEALELLEALEQKKENNQKLRQSPKKAKMLRIRIDAVDSADKVKVNVNLPLSIAKKITKFQGVIPNDAKAKMSDKGINFDEIDLKELIEAFENGEMDENLVDIEANDENGEKVLVKIYVD